MNGIICLSELLTPAQFTVSKSSLTRFLLIVEGFECFYCTVGFSVVVGNSSFSFVLGLCSQGINMWPIALLCPLSCYVMGTTTRLESLHFVQASD